MKINKLISNIESFSADLLGTADLRKLGFLEPKDKINHLKKPELEYYRFGIATKRFLKKDIIELIQSHTKGIDLNKEFNFRKMLVDPYQKGSTETVASMLTSESFIFMLTSIKKIVERQSLYISELIKRISTI